MGVGVMSVVVMRKWLAKKKYEKNSKKEKTKNYLLALPLALQMLKQNGIDLGLGL